MELLFKSLTKVVMAIIATVALLAVIGAVSRALFSFFMLGWNFVSTAMGC